MTSRDSTTTGSSKPATTGWFLISPISSDTSLCMKRASPATLQEPRRGRARYSTVSVGLFVWRLKAYSITHAPAFCVEKAGPQCYTFSALGNNTPLYMRAVDEPDSTTIAGEINVPAPIRRNFFEHVELV